MNSRGNMYKQITTIALSAMLSTMAGADVVMNTILNPATQSADRADISAPAGQTFTTGTLTDNQLSTIAIQAPRDTLNTTPFYIAVYNDTDQNAGTWDPGTLVGVSTSAESFTAVNAVQTWDFSNEVLSNNTVYGYVFTTDAAGTTNIGMRVGFEKDFSANTEAISAGAPFFVPDWDIATTITTTTAGTGVIMNTILDPATQSADRANLSTPAGQTFTTGILTDNQLSTIAIQAPRDQLNTAPFYIAVYNDTDQNAGTWDPSAMVGVSTSAESFADVNAVQTWTFRNAVLSNNTVYGYMLASDAAGTTPIDNMRVGFESDNSASTEAIHGGVSFGSGWDIATMIIAASIDDLDITPFDDLNSSGGEGGPFTPSKMVYTLENLSTSNAIDWVGGSSESWVSVVPASGTLSSGETVAVTVSINAVAETLPPGTHTDSVVFSNTVSAATQTRSVELRVESVASMPFSEDFESGILETYWSINGTEEYRTQVTLENEPHGGTYHVTMDDSVDGSAYSRNELTLGIDLANYENVVLSFWAKDFGDEEHGPPTIPFTDGADFDGVAISEDGVLWYEVQGLRNEINAIYTLLTVDLDAAMATHGLSYNSTFQIRFNQYDNFSIPTDGIAIDDITVSGNIADDLRVDPAEGLMSTGYIGGPFSPPSSSYTLSNANVSSTVSWSAENNETWLSVAPDSGVLDPGGTVDVTVSINTGAQTLPVGSYTDTVVFSNQLSGGVRTRDIGLEVLPIPGEIDVQDSIAPVDDLAMPFGDVIIGLSRTEQITVTNSDPTHGVILSDIRIGSASSPLGSVHVPAFNGELEQYDHPVSIGKRPSNGGATRGDAPIIAAAPSDVPCFGVDMVNEELVSFTTATPGSLTSIASSGANLIPSVDFLNGDFSTLYGLDYEANELIRFDTASGVKTVVGSLGAASGQSWTGLSGDPTDGTLYASSTDGSTSKLYSIDPTTGTATEIGDVTGAPALIDIAVGADGAMYGVDIISDSLVSIDKTTGAGTVVGALGVNANFAQGMDFDEENNILYWAAYTTDAELRVIDTATGASAPADAFPSGTEMCIAVANGGVGAYAVTNHPVLPYTIPPLGSMTFDVVFAPLAVGTIQARAIIENNDEDEPTVEVALSGNGILDYLEVTPETGMASSGHPGGPFTPSSIDYALENISDSPQDWMASVGESWLQLSSGGGTLAVGNATTVTVSLAAAADLLLEGDYHDTVIFSNLTTGITQTRDVSLNVFTTSEIQVSPMEGFVVTNRMGQTTTRTLVVSNAVTADGTLDFTIRARETGRNLLDVAAEGIGAPPTSHDFTKIASGSEYIPGRLLVRFGKGLQASGQNVAAASLGGTIVRRYKLVPGLCVVELDASTSIDQALVSFNAATDVVYAQPDYIWKLDRTPNDTRFTDLWGMHNTGQTGGTPDADIDAPEAWDVATGNDGIVVAVIDTGIDYTHPDLDDNMWVNTGEIPGNGLDDDGNGYVDDVHGYDFVNDDGDPMDDHDHGTHCAGTVGGEGDNAEGVVGVCWDVRIMAIKFLGAGGGSTADAISSVEYATLMGAKVMSNSWGGGGYNQALKDVIDAAGALGIPFVAAAGNDGTDNDSIPHYPSSYESDNVIAVVNSDHNDAKAGTSCYGLISTDLAAPGSSILSCKRGGGYVSASGTSMATPHVAGACALMLSINPELTAVEIKQILMETVDPTLPGVCASGGRMNLANAIAEVGEPWLGVAPDNGSDIAPGNSVNVTVSFDASAVAAGTYTGEVAVASNDPATPSVIIPARMLVEPDDLDISPNGAFESAGLVGGPFSPTSMEYNLTNNGTATLDWNVLESASWLDVSPSSGTIPAGAATVVTASINGSANTLPAGSYAEQLVFSNLTSGAAQPRNVELEISLPPPEVFHSFPMNSNPGWATEGQWEFGQPLGGGSGNGDPTSGHTGLNVYGYNLAGDYPNSMPQYWLTTTAMDCSAHENVALRFYRWLGVESSSFDHAEIEVSNDGSIWSTVWSHAGGDTSDSSWQEMSYDISAVADGEPTVYIRWGMGTTDSSVIYPGWNIDDVVLEGNPTTDDADGDGIPDAWETTYFGHPSNCVATVDWDLDGHSNLQEYFTGMNPTNAASVFAVTNLASMSGSLYFVIEWPSVTGRVYTAFWSTNLTGGFELLEPDIEYPRNSSTDTVHRSGGECFYEVEVRME